MNLKAFNTKTIVATVSSLVFVIVILPLNEAIAFDYIGSGLSLKLLALIKIFFFIFLTCLIRFCLDFYQRLHNKDKLYMLWAKITVLYFILMIFLLLLTFPGVWVWDEWSVLYNVRHGIPNFWQNYLTNFFYTFCLYLFPRAISIVVFQILFLSFVIGYVTTRIWHTLKINSWHKYLMLLPFLTLPVLSNNLYPLRLTMYSYIQLVFLIKLFFLFKTQNTNKSVVFKNLFIFMTLIAILSVWRTECVFYLALIPLIFVKSNFFRKRDFLKTRTYFALGVLVSPVIILMSINFRYIDNYYILTGFFEPLQDIVLTTNNLTKRDRAVISKVIDLEKLKQDNDVFGRAVDRESAQNSQNIRDLQKTYFSLILRNPIIYLKNRLKIFMKTNSFGENIAVVVQGGVNTLLL